jgi:hypothetical protein
MKKIKTLLILLMPIAVSAQFQLKQAITVAGGNFGQPGNYVKYGKYELADQTFQFFDSIPGDFTNAAVADGQMLFSNASNTLYKHDLSTYSRLDSVPFNGTQTLELTNSYLFVGPSTILNANSNKPMVFDRATLDTIVEIDGFVYPIMDMLQIDDSLYVAWNVSSVVDQYPPFNVFADSLGYISVVDITSLTKVRDIELGAAGAGINSLAFDKVNRLIFGANSATNSLTKYNYSTGQLTNIPTNGSNAKDLLGVIGDKLFGTFGADGIGTWSISGDSIISPNVQSGGFIQAALDTINEYLFATTSDFFSFGNLNVFPPSMAQEIFNCGISTESIALDYFNLVGQTETVSQTIGIYPNPSSKSIEIEGSQWIKIYNGLGQIVAQTKGNKLDISALPSNLYYVNTDRGYGKLIKF